MLPKSPLGEAFGYALSHWAALNTFVEHAARLGDVPYGALRHVLDID
ncbi:hypothetical protein [Roseateles sp.]|nr:hypothetical protein [Roseateles sp.]